MEYLGTMQQQFVELNLGNYTYVSVPGSTDRTKLSWQALSQSCSGPAESGRQSGIPHETGRSTHAMSVNKSISARMVTDPLPDEAMRTSCLFHLG